MAIVPIDPRKVDDVVKDAAMAVGSKPYHVCEVIVGLSEVIGRTIASQPVTPLAMREMAQIALNHIENTIVAGVKAQGGNPGDLF